MAAAAEKEKEKEAELKRAQEEAERERKKVPGSSKHPGPFKTDLRVSIALMNVHGYTKIIVRNQLGYLNISPYQIYVTGRLVNQIKPEECEYAQLNGGKPIVSEVRNKYCDRSFALLIRQALAAALITRTRARTANAPISITTPGGMANGV